jgi:hypothetical protein
MGKRPVPVLIVAVVYLLVGVIGFVYHFNELTAGHQDATELTAVIAGVALLMRKNWARWLSLVWVVFHVVISLFHPLRELLVHAALCILIAWLLFRPATARWFKESRAKS